MRNRILSFSFFSLWFLFSCPFVSAKNRSENQLGYQPQWLNLLHYNKESYSSDTYRSYIDDDAFFLSQDGANNPTTELQATIAAFYKKPSSKNLNSHALCRFPARLQWLKEHNQINLSQLPTINCSEFNEWYAEMNSDQITLVFAAAYLNSPSSMFGHTLLRLDNSLAKDDTNWLSYAVNFGADTNNDDGSISFAYKGITGGYDGFFHIMPFYKKIQEYSFMENRELWEYRLNLSTKESKRLILHLWELQNINFAYYYITENCSFRLLELLQVARPGVQLTEPFKNVTIPSDIIQAVVKHGFVESIHYRLPQAKQLDSQIAEIPSDQYTFIDQLMTDDYMPSEAFKQLSIRDKRNLVDTSYQLLRNKTIKKARTTAISKTKLQLLKRLNSYPKKNKTQHKQITPISPDKGHRSRMTSVALGYDRKKAYTQISYRQNYHDLLDNPKGYFSGAEINFFDLDVRLYETGNVKLQKFKILNITSLSARNHFVKPISWHLDTGVEYQNYKKDKLSAFINGGAGTAYQFFDNSLSYGFLDLHLEYNSNFKYTVEPGVGLQLGQLYESDLGTSQLKFDSKLFIDGSYLYSVGFRHNLIVNTNHALRFSLKKSWNEEGGFDQIELAYRYYF
ncbi:MAG: DUF4105 domain-containing protein [Methylococcales bacterium]|nr:DUF4105 domain-containing protein [Methylococcales bacterium]